MIRLASKREHRATPQALTSPGPRLEVPSEVFESLLQCYRYVAAQNDVTARNLRLMLASLLERSVEPQPPQQRQKS